MTAKFMRQCSGKMQSINIRVMPCCFMSSKRMTFLRMLSWVCRGVFHGVPSFGLELRCVPGPEF